MSVFIAIIITSDFITLSNVDNINSHSEMLKIEYWLIDLLMTIIIITKLALG